MFDNYGHNQATQPQPPPPPARIVRFDRKYVETAPGILKIIQIVSTYSCQLSLTFLRQVALRTPSYRYIVSIPDSKLRRVHMHKSDISLGIVYLLQHPLLARQHRLNIPVPVVPLPHRGEVQPLAVAQVRVYIQWVDESDIHWMLDICCDTWRECRICCWGKILAYTK